MRVTGTKITTTSGTYMGYQWEPCTQPGDFSASTRRHIQGHNEPCEIEVIDGWHLAEARSGELRLYPDGNEWSTEADLRSYGPGLSVESAVALEIATIIERRDIADSQGH